MDLDDVFRLLEKATLLEKDGQRIEAATKYYEGCHLMRQIVTRFSHGDKDPMVVLLREKIQCYTLQAQILYFDEGSVVHPTPRRYSSCTTPATITLAARTTTIDDVSVLTLPGNQSSIRSEIHRKVGIANARLERAIYLEEEILNNNNADSNETIIRSYLSAAEAYLSAMKESEASSLPLPPVVQRRLEACLDRTEALKHHARKESLPVDEKKRRLP
jgi:hypothetical protein